MTDEFNLISVKDLADPDSDISKAIDKMHRTEPTLLDVRSSQSKKASLIETIFGLSVGFLVAWVSWIFPIPQLFGIEASRGVAVGVTLYFTVLSFLRGYGVRRLFNYLHNRGNKNV